MWLLALIVVVALVTVGDEDIEQAADTKQTEEKQTEQVAEDNNVNKKLKQNQTESAAARGRSPNGRRNLHTLKKA